MTREQINPVDTPVRRCPLVCSVGVLAVLVGLGLLIWPILRPAVGWRWTLNAEADLVGAEVNAERVSIGDEGVCLLPKGQRPISLITPPLTFEDGCDPVVNLEVLLPGVMARTPHEASVVLLWQTEAVEGFHFAEKVVPLCQRPRVVRFSLPVAPDTVHRLGVQFPGCPGMVCVRSLSLPALTVGDRFHRMREDLLAPEPFRGHSINFLRGPFVLGHGINYYFVSLVMAAVGVYVCRSALRRRRVSGKVVAAMALVVWCTGDLLATRNLVQQYQAEARAFDSGADPIALANTPEIAWAYSQLVENTEAGSTFAVLSDDPFSPSHRLGYLLEPQRVRRKAYEEANYILVIHASGAVFDGAQGVFHWKDGAEVAVEGVNALVPSDVTLPPQVYLLRRVQP